MSKKWNFKRKKVLAIPPQDYDGTIADWIIELIHNGYDGEDYHSIRIPSDIYDEILEKCEAIHE